MRKFKLLKWYPSLRIYYKVGDIVELTNGGSYLKNDKTCTLLLSAIDIENNPEFWGEVKEYDFEILQIKSKQTGTIFNRNYTVDTVINYLPNDEIYSIKRKSDGEIFSIGDKVNNPKLQKPMPFVITKFYFDCNNEYLLCNGEHCGNGHVNITKIEHYKELPYKILKSCPIEGTIYSVERVSDREIFTIGDTCSPTSLNNPAKITKFEFVLDNQLRIQGENGKKRYWYLDISTITKVKTPLFTTFDNVDIFEYDPYHEVIESTATYAGKCITDKNYTPPTWDRLYFSTKEKAEEWIKENKPQYSLLQIFNIIRGFDKEMNEYEEMENKNYLYYIDKYK